MDLPHSGSRGERGRGTEIREEWIGTEMNTNVRNGHKFNWMCGTVDCKKKYSGSEENDGTRTYTCVIKTSSHRASSHEQSKEVLIIHAFLSDIFKIFSTEMLPYVDLS